MRASARQETAIRGMTKRRAAVLLVLWLRFSQREARNRRVAAAHRAAAMSGVFRAVFQQWQILGASAAKRTQLEESTSLKVSYFQPFTYLVPD